MNDDTPPNEYFSRGSVIRGRPTHGVPFTDHEANKHLARCLSAVFGVQKGIFLSNPDLTCQDLEDVVFSAQGEMDMARDRELRNGMGHALSLSLAQARAEGVLSTVVQVVDGGCRRRSRRRDNRGGNQQ